MISTADQTCAPFSPRFHSFPVSYLHFIGLFFQHTLSLCYCNNIQSSTDLLQQIVISLTKIPRIAVFPSLYQLKILFCGSPLRQKQ